MPKYYILDNKLASTVHQHYLHAMHYPWDLVQYYSVQIRYEELCIQPLTCRIDIVHRM